MMTFLDGVVAAGEKSGNYVVVRRRCTDYCVSQPEVQVGGDFYISKSQIQKSTLEMCEEEYPAVFVEKGVGYANVLTTSLQAHSNSVVADCTTREATLASKGIGTSFDLHNLFSM